METADIHPQSHGQSCATERCGINRGTSTINTNTDNKTGFQLGMSSFNANDRKNFGESVRLAMACMEGRTAPPPGSGLSLPTDAPSIAQRLQSLTEDITASHADQLELLVRFDDLKGWDYAGARHCAAWMNSELGISVKLGWEYLRVGRRLRDLPTLTALFRAGKLSWSKVRLISRVANEDNESLLCHTALDASVSDVARICSEYRWQDDDQAQENERARALQQWESRSLRWDNCSNGNIRISLSVPPEIAQAFLNSVEYSLSQLESSDQSSTITSETSMSQKRADAAILMAENNLQSAGRDITTADRYQVIVSVDVAELRNDTLSNEKTIKPETPTTPSQRASIIGAASENTALAKDSVRRLTCDCSLSSIINSKGEPIHIGKKTRVWPTAMARAIKARDKHCVFPGCTQTRHLHIHHLVHWADGGSTCVDNGACLCAHHHTLVHEGGYRIERVSEQEQGRDEQAESFDRIWKISTERFRFRVIDQDGRVIGARRDKQRPSTRGDYLPGDSSLDDNTRDDDASVAEPLVAYPVMSASLPYTILLSGVHQ